MYNKLLEIRDANNGELKNISDEFVLENYEELLNDLEYDNDAREIAAESSLFAFMYLTHRIGPLLEACTDGFERTQITSNFVHVMNQIPEYKDCATTIITTAIESMISDCGPSHESSLGCTVSSDVNKIMDFSKKSPARGMVDLVKADPVGIINAKVKSELSNDKSFKKINSLVLDPNISLECKMFLYNNYKDNYNQYALECNMHLLAAVAEGRDDVLERAIESIAFETIG